MRERPTSVLSLTPTHNIRGIAFMVMATASFIVNDSMLKLVMEDVPPYEALLIRSVLQVALCVALLPFAGGFRFLPSAIEPKVMLRNGFELLAVFGYILGLKYAPIADMTALSQLTPMLLTIAAVWFFGAKIGRGEIALIVVAFVGAVLVAQPGGSGFSAFALLGLWNAVCCAGRDLFGRRVSANVPAMAVAIGAGLVTIVGTGIATLIFEQFVMPDGRQWLLLIGASIFVTGGQVLIFLAYRNGEVGAVAPFFYSGTIWALIAGAVAFQTIPNALALFGIALILVSGVSVVLLDARRAKALRS